MIGSDTRRLLKATELMQSRRWLVLTAHVSVYAISCFTVVVTEWTVIAFCALGVLRFNVVSHIGRLGCEATLGALPPPAPQAHHHRV